MIRIVTADDNANLRSSITRLLNRDPIMEVVGEAENGAQALALVEIFHPDILIVDIEMPVMTGIQVAQALEGREIATKIIILSNYADREFVEGLLGLGVYGYLIKEDAPGHLVEAVHQVFDLDEQWLSLAVQKYAAI
jgi:two-component system response regulator DesR